MASASENVKVGEMPATNAFDDGLCSESKMVTESTLKLKKAAFRPAHAGAAENSKNVKVPGEENCETEESGWSFSDEPSAAQRVAASISDHLAKRQRRAERFGLNLQVTEAERRQIRAVRFGPVTSTARGKNTNGSKLEPLCPQTEQQKRKARAARFGCQTPEETDASSSYGSEAKKRARAARFGLQVEPQIVKIMARAARFGSAAPIQVVQGSNSRQTELACTAM